MDFSKIEDKKKENTREDTTKDFEPEKEMHGR
jgi:hypothetical protein